ncbi:mutator type transposase [Tanacetum coccineum]
MIAKNVGPLTSSVTKLFDAIKKATKYIVQWNGGFLYQVNGPYKDQCVVNMETRLCSCRKWELTGIPCKHVVAAIYNTFENSVGVVNPCNGRKMWPVVEAITVIVPPLYKPQVGRPPKKRKKSHDEIENESCSSGKIFRKGKSFMCGKYGNVGHNRKGCKGQGGATQAAGARTVSGQGGARRTASARNVSGQAGGASNVSSQSPGSSQPIAAQSTSTGVRNASSQPSKTPSTIS